MLPTSDSHFCLNSTAVMEHWDVLLNIHQLIPKRHATGLFTLFEKTPLDRPSGTTRVARARGAAKALRKFCLRHKNEKYFTEGWDRYLNKWFDCAPPRSTKHCKGSKNYPAWVEKDIDEWVKRTENPDYVKQFKTPVKNIHHIISALDSEMRRCKTFSERAQRDFQQRVYDLAWHFECPDDCFVCPRIDKKIRYGY